jgi:hypothetical protein
MMNIKMRNGYISQRLEHYTWSPINEEKEFLLNGYLFNIYRHKIY